MILSTILLFLLLLGIVILAAVVCFMTIRLFFDAMLTIPFGAPFVPSIDQKLATMLKLAHVHPGEKAVDLGSGDGKIVIALAEAGAEAHGYEINILLVWQARHRIRRAGLQRKAFIHWGSFWKADLSSFQLVIVYGISHIMRHLEKKLQKELPPNARVVSNAFNFPTWQPTKKENRVYLYERV